MKLLFSFFSGSSRTVALKKNIFASLGIRALSIIVSFLLVPATLGYVTDELYGVWLTLSSVLLWINFFDIGLTLGLKNRLAEALARSDIDTGRRLVSTTYAMMIMIFIPLMAILQLLLPMVSWHSFLSVDAIYEPDLHRCMSILSVFVCLQMIVNVIGAIFAAYQKVALSAFLPVIGNVCSLIVILVIRNSVPPSLPVLALVFSSIPVAVTFCGSLFFFRGMFRAVRPSFSFCDFSRVRDIFSLGVKFFLIQVQVVVFFQTTNILISHVAGPVHVTEYNIAYKYLNAAEMVMTILVAPLWPAFTDAYCKRDFSWMQRIYHKMRKVAYMVIFSLVVMVALSPLVYSIWIGGKAEVHFMMTALIGFCMILQTFIALDVNIINGIGTVKLQTIVTLVGTILHIPLSLLLGEYWGAYGVVCSMIFIRFIYFPMFRIQTNKLLYNKAYGVWGQ